MQNKNNFLLEIEEQPQALRQMAEYYQKEAEELLKQAANLCQCESGGRIIFTGMGTSQHAANIINSALADSGTGLPIIIEAGELLHHGLEGIRPEDTVIAISQSGESFETAEVARKFAGLRLLAITNDPQSSLAQSANVSLPMLAGREQSISAKTYTNTLAVLLLLANEIVGGNKNELINKLLCCVDSMEKFIAKRSDEVIAGAEFLRQADFLYFISRGPSMAAAQQAALTWMEGVHLPTAVMPGGSFRHGPYELIYPGFHAIFYAPDSEAGSLLEKMVVEIAGFGARVLVFSGRRMKPGDNIFVIELEPGNDCLLPLTTAIPQELLLVQMAKDRGWTAGVFERGGKVTGKE